MFRDRRLTWREVTDRTRRLANLLAGAGLGARRGGPVPASRATSRTRTTSPSTSTTATSTSSRWSGRSRREWHRSTSTTGTWPRSCSTCSTTVRRAPSSSTAQFAPTLAEVLPDLPRLALLLQVPDESGNDLLEGAVWYEDALASASAGLAGVRAGVVARRPVRALHGRNDRHAERRAVAPARHLHVGDGRRGHGRAPRIARIRGRRRRKPGCCG